MSGTRSALKMAPRIDPRWRLALLLWPFVAATVAINLFLLGLIAHAVGWPGMTPVAALIWAVPISLPANWAASRWVRRLIDEAEGHPKSQPRKDQP